MPDRIEHDDNAWRRPFAMSPPRHLRGDRVLRSPNQAADPAQGINPPAVRSRGERAVDACQVPVGPARYAPDQALGILLPDPNRLQRLTFAIASMSLRHPYRRPIAWLLAICLLFAQTAALAYACALDQAPLAAEVSRAPCPAHPDDVDTGMFGSGNLCEVHCQTPTVSYIQAGLDVPPAALAPHTVAPPIADAVVFRTPPPDPLRTPPRVLLRTSRLLI